ncbi:MAG: hypothetical protein ACYTFZ_08765 [Planctomycetota bacterium]|jgi:hypothetical protein
MASEISWTIGIPAWGERAVRNLTQTLLPSLIASLEEACVRDVMFVVETDEHEAVGEALKRHSHMLLDVQESVCSDHVRLTRTHKKALKLTPEGHINVPLCADHAVSLECIKAWRARLDGGAKACLMLGLRALEQHRPGPGLPAWQLIRHMLDHMHPITKEHIWGTGRTRCPTFFLFEDAEGYVAHVFHLHPTAFIKPATMKWTGTVDDDLIATFAPSERYIMADPAEAAIIELSPPEARQTCWNAPARVDRIRPWVKSYTSPCHRESFRHPITVTGPVGRDPGREVAAKILEGMR